MGTSLTTRVVLEWYLMGTKWVLDGYLMGTRWVLDGYLTPSFYAFVWFLLAG